MSKINSCYPLCPLIDQKSFFGVSDDCESGYVVVTLGKNMVVRYKLSDQKQVNSWNSKVGLRLSSSVVFDRNSKQYVGVFNSNTIQMWSEFDVDLNKVKKYKFARAIHCVLSDTSDKVNSDRPSVVIVFKNGCVLPLTAKLLAKRKCVEAIEKTTYASATLYKDDGDSTIEDARLLTAAGNNRHAVVVLVCSNSSNKNLVCHLVPLDSDSFQPVSCNLSHRDYKKSSSSTSEENVGGDPVNLTGYTFVNSDPLKLITCWSDGGLYCLDVSLSTTSSENINNQFPGVKIMDINAIINVNLKVAMLPLDIMGCHIAIYGSDPSEEGALLAIVNIKHKVIQCKYDLKLYCISPKLWSGGPTDLLLIVGQHLAVAHYRLVSQKLAALVGTQVDTGPLTGNVLHTVWHNKRKMLDEQLQVSVSKSAAMKTNSLTDGDLDLLMYVDDNDTMSLSALVSEKQVAHLKESVQLLFNEGLSEAGICDKLLPTLIETRNTSALIWMFNEFNDVPFHCSLLVVNYCLYKIARENFIEDDVAGDNKDTVALLSAPDADTDGTTKDDNIVKVLLLYALSTSLVPDNKALSLVRSELPLKLGLALMNCLIDFMTERPNNTRLIDWAILLLDSYYQSFIITKDMQVIKTFKRLNNCVANQISFTTAWQDLLPLISMIKNGKGVPRSICTNSDRLYSCDKMNVY